MSGNLQGKAIVIMGVSGAGKSLRTDRESKKEMMISATLVCPNRVVFALCSTIGEMLGRALCCDFLDADDFHSPLNRDKMCEGIPLSDEDRIPWLETLRDALQKRLIVGETVVLGCSSLKNQYREILRAADPDYEPGSYNSKVKFVLLEAQAEVIAARLEKRAAEGKHFMPPTLLQSQLDSLEVDDCEGIFKIDAVQSPEVIVNKIHEQLFSLTNSLKH